jgi:hypothetical protein
MQTGAAQLAVAEPLLLQLLDLYQQQQELPVEPLRHPKLLQLLLSGVCVLPSVMSFSAQICLNQLLHTPAGSATAMLYISLSAASETCTGAAALELYACVCLPGCHRSTAAAAAGLAASTACELFERCAESECHVI